MGIETNPDRAARVRAERLAWAELRGLDRRPADVAEALARLRSDLDAHAARRGRGTPMDRPSATYLRRELSDGTEYDVFTVLCVCGAHGELGVPVYERGTFGCPWGCRTTWVKRDSPGGGQPELMAVVVPVFTPPR